MNTQDTLQNILNDLRKIDYPIDIQHHDVEMKLGPDWAFIIDSINNEGYKAEPIGIVLRIKW